MEKYSRIKALISLDAIRYNFEQMKKNIKEGTKIIAVIKADAYGHGAVPIARMLEEFDYIWGFTLRYSPGGITASKSWDHKTDSDPGTGI